MKILLYTEGLKAISKSGLGKAIGHQKKSLEDNKIEYTTNLKDNYDILHINFYGPKSYFYAKKAKRKGKRIVYHAHSTEEDFRNSFLFSNLVSPLFKKWLITCYKLGDYIITPTEYSKRLLLNYNMERPIKAISNGVDTKFFERNEKAGSEFRKQYGYKDTDKVIVGIGLYIKRKGILDFVELAKRLPEYKFIWFGYSPLWASPREIKKAVHTKLPNLCFAGYVESSVIKSALSGADLYLFPTLEETEGIPIIEALTSKIPTLIRDIPVFEEYKENEVVYKAKDLDDFEDKIKKIMNKKLPDLTENGYKEAKKKDVKAVGKELIDTYKEVLSIPIDKEKLEEERRTRKKNKLLGIFITLGIIITTIFLFICQKQATIPLEKYTRTIDALDTKIDVTLYSKSSKKAEKELDKIEDIYGKYDRLTSRKEGSILYEIHHHSTEEETITVEEDLYKMLRYGKNWYEKSNGKLNINLGNVTDIWSSYREKGIGIPTSKELESAGSIDIKDIELLGNNTIKNNQSNIDLDTIKLGYATEEVIEYLEDNHLNIYLINASSVIAAGDHYIEGEKYLVAIASPFKDNNEELLTNIRFTNGVIVTKGIYQNAYKYDGKDYGTMIDPDTRKPAENVVGVTVLGKSVRDTEAIATTLFLMRGEEGKKYIDTNTNFAVIWAYLSNGEEKTVITDNFYNFFQS